MTGADLGVAKAGQGPAVEFDRPLNDEAAAAFLDARLKRLRQGEIDLSDVVVITLRDTIEESSASKTKAFTRGQLVPVTDGRLPTQSGVARLVTTTTFKGLEAAHVLVVDVDDVATPQAMARLYVAMSRPRISLWLAVGPVAWQQLTEAPRRNPDD